MGRKEEGNEGVSGDDREVEGGEIGWKGAGCWSCCVLYVVSFC